MPEVATVASPSSCDRLDLILLHASATQPLLGAMLAVDVPFSDGSTEVCLGTITAIETVNALADPRGVMASHIAADSGSNLTRASQDTRRVVMKVEAVFRGTPGSWKRWSSTLSNSPATGTRVRVLDQATADDLMADENTVGCVGHLRGSDHVRLPLTLSDFSGPRGATHLAFLGATGSGKSSVAAMVLATMMRHPQMGFIVLDPQSQWSSEHGLPISLQGVAAALGRKVTVARISQSLRLQKDAPMFLQLLQESGFFRHLAFGAGADDNIAAAREVLTAALGRTQDVHSACGTADWTDADSTALLRYLLQTLYDILPTGTVYAGRDQQDRVGATLHRPECDSRGEPIPQAMLDRLPPGALDAGGSERFDQLLEIFAAIHQLWLPYNAAGLAQIAAGTPAGELGEEYQRRSAWGLLAEALRPPDGAPAPLLILDLSADATASDKAAEILDSTDVKARIMHQLVTTTKRAGQQGFKNGYVHNTCWIVDEAWQWCGPVDSRTQSEAVVALSNEWAASARDVRKFGIGIALITQSTTSIRDDVWRQLSVLFVGYGLHDSADLKRLGNRMSDAHVQLYKAAPPPAATGRYVWCCIGGSVTGLSFGPNPVFVEAFTDAHAWLDANQHWITELRQRYLHCLPTGDAGGSLTVPPTRPPITDASSAAHTAVTDARTRPVAAGVLTSFRPAASTAAVSSPTSRRWATSSRIDDDRPPF